MAEEKFVVKVENGYAKLFDLNGNFKRYVCDKAVKAELMGGKIRVTTREGKVKAYHVEDLFKETSAQR